MDSEEAGKKEHQDHLSPYPVSRLAPAFELVDLAREIARADDMLSAQTSARLRLLAEQIRGLQEQARNILEETSRNQQLHRAECGFKKKAGHVYHLYRRGDGRLAFSLLSPEDWGGQPPHEFVASYRLETDMSWTQCPPGSGPGDPGQAE